MGDDHRNDGDAGDWQDRPTFYLSDDRAIGEPPFEYLRRYVAELDRVRALVSRSVPDSHILSGPILLPDTVYAQARRHATVLLPSEPSTWETRPAPHAVDIRAWCDYCSEWPGAVCVTAAGRSAMWAHVSRRRNLRLAYE